MAKQWIAEVVKCGKCPGLMINIPYHHPWCSKTKKDIWNIDDAIPDWCPLPDAPKDKENKNE